MLPRTGANGAGMGCWAPLKEENTTETRRTQRLFEQLGRKPRHVCHRLCQCGLWDARSNVGKNTGRAGGTPGKQGTQGWSVHSCADGEAIGSCSCGGHSYGGLTCQPALAFDGERRLAAQAKLPEAARPGSRVRTIPAIFSVFSVTPWFSSLQNCVDTSGGSLRSTASHPLLKLDSP
uniref:Uncharacterized protein n=1 Tax=Rubinisphaera brasiliensis (strain ATCC 49424 / DSM 5305 / JCM 21570 / IAM 15109 / NBRC 103401 / IFAM 1448) TaxID=756272 RepID=F0SNP6_RUBBR|nr:hypothetical protein Plabr_1320 [Rubinisphaera brasiliensis DSM 5305]